MFTIHRLTYLQRYNFLCIGHDFSLVFIPQLFTFAPQNAKTQAIFFLQTAQHAGITAHLLRYIYTSRGENAMFRSDKSHRFPRDKTFHIHCQRDSHQDYDSPISDVYFQHSKGCQPLFVS